LSSKEPGIVETVLATVFLAQLGSASIGVRTPPDSTAHAGWMIGIKAPHGEENDSVTVTGYRPVPSATMLSKGLPVCQMVLPFFPPLNRSRSA
jgi:hypothetical protein